MNRFVNHDDTILDNNGSQLISTDEIVELLNEQDKIIKGLKEENIYLKNRLFLFPLIGDIGDMDE